MYKPQSCQNYLATQNCSNIHYFYARISQPSTPITKVLCKLSVTSKRTLAEQPLSHAAVTLIIIIFQCCAVLTVHLHNSHYMYESVTCHMMVTLTVIPCTCVCYTHCSGSRNPISIVHRGWLRALAIICHSDACTLSLDLTETIIMHQSLSVRV